MDIKGYYDDYKLKINSTIDASLLDVSLANNLALCFSFVEDYENWLICIGERLESILFVNSIKVYQDALGCMLEGKYQSAFMGLRYCFERTLCGVYLSSSEIDLRTWLGGGRDTYWVEIVGKEGKDVDGSINGEDGNSDKGLFSYKFVRAFFPELLDERMHFRRIAASVYRECSEYVHGNPNALAQIPKHIEYNKELMSLWCDKALTMKRVICFVFAMRYLGGMTEEKKGILAPIIKEELASVKPIINLL